MLKGVINSYQQGYNLPVWKLLHLYISAESSSTNREGLGILCPCVVTLFQDMKSNLSIILAISAAFVAAPLGRAAVLVNTTQTRAIFDLTGYTGAGFEPGADTVATGRLDSNNVRVGGVSDGDMAFGDSFYTALVPLNLLSMAFWMMVVIVIVSLYPAWYAARLQPVEALHAL